MIVSWGDAMLNSSLARLPPRTVRRGGSAAEVLFFTPKMSVIKMLRENRNGMGRLFNGETISAEGNSA